MRFLGLFWPSPIIELTAQNFGDVIRNNRLVLVYFHKPSCRFCKKFEPEFAKVAQTLQVKAPDVKVAKLNGLTETTIATEQGIERYPTVKLFKKTVGIRYEGPQEALKLINWLDQRIFYNET
ncbi:unnamed protein product [Phyllotreta striolata]|uniref:Thioredoxin domain-containing protein n=1 Tax=Phyllotreta striolata TaxID=444603 RepID=A0A9N9U089_PHYSR|nr:unnamed protein product [Phyllotreta striolata]